MTLTEQAAYLKGLYSGLGLEKSDDGALKIQGETLDLLSAMAKAIEEINTKLADVKTDVESVQEDVSDLQEQVDDLEDSVTDLEDAMDELEDDFYDDDDDDDDEDEDDEDEDEDDDDEDFDFDFDDLDLSDTLFTVRCTNCGEEVYVDEDDVDAGSAECPFCGTTFPVKKPGN